MIKNSDVRRAVAAVLACSAAAHAVADPVDIPAGELRTALLAVSERFGADLVYRPEHVRGVSTSGAHGDLTTKQAISSLLQGTPLELRTDPSGAMLIAQAGPEGQIVAQAAPPVQSTPEPESTPAAAAADEESMEEVVVTGSNLRRRDVGVLPMTVLSKDAMNLRDALTPVEILTSLPQVTGVPASEAPRGGSGARGDISTVSMRGLAASSTLVLLNGRRLTAHPTTEDMDFAPNVNQLPTQGLARIEVLRDGASSIYGSDAVAGVVNYITARDFEGTQGRLRYGAPEHPGGQNIDFTLTHGQQFAEGRFRVLTTLDWFDRDGIYLRDREFADTAQNFTRVPAPFNAPGGPFDGRASTGVFWNFRLGTSTQANYFRPVNGAMTLTTTAPTRANNPEFYGNSNDYTMAIGDSRRFNMFTSLEYDLTDDITLFSDLSYYKADSLLVRSPLGLNAPAADYLAPMPADNPYNPYGSRFYDPAGAPNADGTPRIVGTPRAITLVSGPFSTIPEEVSVSGQTWRIVAGARGKFADNWNWEVGGVHSYSYAIDRNTPHVRESLLHEALARTDPATAYNPFGYTFRVDGNQVVADQPHTNSEGTYQSFMQEWRRYGNSTLTSVDARVSGPVLSIWSGDISVAAGAEYRIEEYADFRPPFHGTNPVGSGLDPNNNDFSPSSPKPDADGDRKVTSFYAETVVPLVSRDNHVPLVQSLELNASVRHEDYSDFGTTTKPKFGVNWRPIQALMLRASYNEGFTAPSLPLLHMQNQWSFAGPPGAVDIYRNPATNEGPYVSRNGTSGNPDLRPIDSEGISAGFVLDVPGVQGLSVSADYWEIKQDNLIGSLSAAQIRNNDMVLLQEYTRAQIAAGVPLASINFGEGTANYVGDPAVIREAPTDADRALFATYNAANPGNPLGVAGRVFQIDAPPLNLSDGISAGWDFSIKYNKATSIGDISFDTDWALVTESNTTLEVPGGAAIYTERLNVDGVSKWRGTTNITWRNAGWSAGASAYFIGSFADSLATTTAAQYEAFGEPDYIVHQYTGNSDVYRYRVEDILYFNAFGAYKFDESAGGALSDSSIRLGLINVTDEAPPVSSGNFGFGYSGRVHGALVAGRTVTIEFVKRF
ncbi:MAG: TonB-dependent receptor [Pseudomonadota bacterium]